jgi:hypothetical protein
MLADPIAEYTLITQWLGQFIGQTTTPKQFVHKLGIFLSRRHPITVRLEFNNTILGQDEFTIGGLYDVVRDEDKLKPLAFFFIMNHPADTLWPITESIVDELALELIEALAHEYQHLYQYRTRDYILNRDYKSRAKDPKLKEDQEYLGQPDEIDAYATNIAVKFYLGNHGMSQTAKKFSLDLKNYYKAFGPDHPVVKQLIKKVIKKLQYLESHYNATET